MKQTLLLAATIFCFTNLTLAQAGHLDPSFGNNGIVKTIIGKSFHHVFFDVGQILLQSDESMYSLHGFSLTKRHSDGSVDSSYGPVGNGFSADAGFDISRAALQADGKIVVVGTYYDRTRYNYYYPNGSPDFAVARFKTDGSLDSSFGENGKSTTTSGIDDDEIDNTDYGCAVAIQKDGKTVIMGYSNDKLALLRYNTNGSLDSTFDGDGIVLGSEVNFEYYYAYQYPHGSIAIGDDGKIVVAGEEFSFVVRYNTDGSFDKTFEENVKHPFLSVNALAVQNDGKTVAAAYVVDSLHYDSSTYSYPLLSVLARYNTDGSFDKSFSFNGKQAEGFRFYRIALQKDGKIVTGGDTILARFNTGGHLDKTFSGDGKQIVNITDYISSIAIRYDGKIVTAGGNTFFRFTDTGSLDTTFGVNGKVDYTPLAGHTTYYTTAFQKDGKILAAGTALTGDSLECVIARYNSDGSLDSTFSRDGIVKTGVTVAEDIYSTPRIGLAIENDEKIVAATGNYIIVYNADGSLDNTFANKGKLTNPVIISPALAIQSDGKIVVANYDKNNNTAIARYNRDGSLDKTFGTNGKQVIAVIYDDDIEIHSLAIQPDGKIVAALILHRDDADYDGYVLLTRLNTNGSIDSAFGDGGTVDARVGGNSCDIAVQNDGKIVAAASGDDHDTGNTDVARLNSDGTIDSTFYGNGAFELYKSAERTLLAIQNDGKIVVSGIEFFRLNTDGSRDYTFNNKAAQEVDFGINDLAVLNDKLYAVGGGYYGEVARYLLDNSNTPPIVSLTAPANNAKYLAPAAHIKLNAAASDSDGTITKVEFYNGNKLLHTETVIPYGYNWRNVAAGNYTLTAKAYDNSGNVTTSAAVHISVVANQPPVVSIVKPANNQSFDAPATIHFVAAASDTDGRITRVEFYKDSTLLRTEYKHPYTYNWKNAAAGSYTITAKATDNWGAQTTSAPITVTVTSTSIVSSRPYSKNEKNALNDGLRLRLRLSPNPASNIVNISTSGLQLSKPATLSIISLSGIVHKTMRITNAATQVDVSSLVSGVYTIKIVSGDRVMYKQFVKL